MKRIKVCFVQGYGYAVFNPHSSARIGGAEVDLYNIAIELAKDNRFKVYFLVADFGQNPLEIYNNVYVVKGHSLKKSVKNFIFSFFKFFKKLKQINADIYFTANQSKYVGLTNFYSKIFGKIHIHRTEHQDQVNKSFILRRIRRGSTRYLMFLLGYMNVNHIVVQNDEHKEMLKKTFNYPSTVIRNSYQIPARVQLEKDSILWVARGENWKRPEVFIKLAKAFPQESFVMIMPMGNKPGFFEIIKVEALKVKNLEFIPGVPFSEVENYYKKSKIFVNTSFSEGFPNSFNQAMNFSTPILSYKINPDDFLNKFNVGIYCNDDFNDLKEGLRRLVSDDKLLAQLSENAYNFVNQEMNIVNSIKKWKYIFNYFYKKKYE